MTLTTAGPKKSHGDGAEGEMSTNEKQTAEDVRELVYRIASARMNLALGLGPLADLA